MRFGSSTKHFGNCGWNSIPTRPLSGGSNGDLRFWDKPFWALLLDYGRGRDWSCAFKLGSNFENVWFGFMSRTPRWRKSGEALSYTFDAGNDGWLVVWGKLSVCLRVVTRAHFACPLDQ